MSRSYLYSVSVTACHLDSIFPVPSLWFEVAIQVGRVIWMPLFGQFQVVSLHLPSFQLLQDFRVLIELCSVRSPRGDDNACLATHFLEMPEIMGSFWYQRQF